MRKVINIRGTNGSGKSTFPIELLKRSTDNEQIDFITEEGVKAALTVLHDTRWVFLGKYKGVKTGGLDTIRTTQAIKDSLYKALKDYPEYNVIMEGILCSTVRSTYVDLFIDIRKNYDVEIVIVGLTTPLEVCLERIQERNGGKDINEQLVVDKHRTVERGLPYFNNGIFKVVKIDTSKYDLPKLIDKFERLYEVKR